MVCECGLGCVGQMGAEGGEEMRDSRIRIRIRSSNRERQRIRGRKREAWGDVLHAKIDDTHTLTLVPVLCVHRWMVCVEHYVCKHRPRKHHSSKTHTPPLIPQTHPSNTLTHLVVLCCQPLFPCGLLVLLLLLLQRLQLSLLGCLDLWVQPLLCVWQQAPTIASATGALPR